jgi:hypothetical protein
MDSDGKRILSKYYTDELPGAKEQKAFEKSLFEKSKKAASKLHIADIRRNNAA